MAESATDKTGRSDDPETLEVTLRDPMLAGFLAWLIPGAGHIYQGRTAKGVLFSVCIFTLFFFGMYLGGNRVVYASNRPDNRRLPYLCQVATGLPTMLALVQAHRMGQDPPKAPLFSGYMAPPRYEGQIVPSGSIAPINASPWGNDTAYVRNSKDELSAWQAELHRFFELGTVYTMIAGLLNVLVIYDAWCGPMLIPAENSEKTAKRNQES